MALAIASEPRLALHVILDERSAAFFALGLARATAVPAMVLCTSGTAAVEFHPAVVEASLDRVPMLVVTADRPPELHGIGAPQTVDQNRLYGRSPRAFFEPGVPDWTTSSTWRSQGARAFLAATGGAGAPGPVHLNLAFREPLIGSPRSLPKGRPDNAPWHTRVAGATLADVTTPRDVSTMLAAKLLGRRGLLVAGPGSGDPEALFGLATALAWPLVADPRSGARVVSSCPALVHVRESSVAVATTETWDLSSQNVASQQPQNLRFPALVVAHADTFLRSPSLADELRPEVVLRFGAPFASKVFNEWLGTIDEDWLVDPYGAWLDPNRASSVSISAEPAAFCRVLTERALACEINPAGNEWCDLWAAAEHAVRESLVQNLDVVNEVVSEPAIVRTLHATLPEGSHMFVASSMPIRDLEWFSAPRSGVTIHANRGANGIDGTISTALGVAAANLGRTVALLGDLSFLHDAGALVLAAQQNHDCTFVVIDNGGGGIFEFLPQATSVERERFEMLYGTRQSVDIVRLCEAHGLRVALTDSVSTIASSALEFLRSGGVSVVVIRTDREANVGIHRTINELGAAAAEARVAALRTSLDGL